MTRTTYTEASLQTLRRQLSGSVGYRYRQNQGQQEASEVRSWVGGAPFHWPTQQRRKGYAALTKCCFGMRWPREWFEGKRDRSTAFFAWRVLNLFDSLKR
jgi:hypothetical protein